MGEPFKQSFENYLSLKERLRTERVSLDFDVSDLKDEFNIVNSKQTIQELALEWDTLERQFSSTVSPGMDGLPSQEPHIIGAHMLQKIPQQNRDEYCQGVAEIIRRAPKLGGEATGRTAGPVHSTQHKKLLEALGSNQWYSLVPTDMLTLYHNKANQTSYATKPGSGPLSSSDRDTGNKRQRLSTGTTAGCDDVVSASSSSTTSDVANRSDSTSRDVVMSFVMCDTADNAPQQQVEVLGRQSLADLCDTLYCLSDHMPYADTAATGDRFLFLEGQFYADTTQSQPQPQPDTCAGAVVGSNGNSLGVVPSTGSASRVSQWLHSVDAKLGVAEAEASTAPVVMVAVTNISITGGGTAVVQPAVSASAGVTSSDLMAAAPDGIGDIDTTALEANTTFTGGALATHYAAGNHGGARAKRARPLPTRETLRTLYGYCSSTGSTGGGCESGVSSARIHDLRSTRCDSLPLQLATRYLYSHCGGCEHYIYLSDIRLRHPRCEPVNTDAYPRTVYQKQFKRRRCQVCDIAPAKFIVYGDRLAETSPCFYCEQCYHMLHYSEDGDHLLYGDFQVFPYTHDM